MTEPPANTNPLRVLFEEINDAELEPNEIEKRNQERHRHHQQQQPKQPEFLHPSIMEGGTSSYPPFNIEPAFANLSLQVKQLARTVATPHPSPELSIYESNIYNYHVDRGIFLLTSTSPIILPSQDPFLTGSRRKLTRTVTLCRARALHTPIGKGRVLCTTRLEPSLPITSPCQVAVITRVIPTTQGARVSLRAIMADGKLMVLLSR